MRHVGLIKHAKLQRPRKESFGLECTNTSTTDNYMNSPEVRKRLKIPNFVGKWEVCKQPATDDNLPVHFLKAL